MQYDLEFLDVGKHLEQLGEKRIRDRCESLRALEAVKCLHRRDTSKEPRTYD
jgi:hypothetical protein